MNFKFIDTTNCGITKSYNTTGGNAISGYTISVNIESVNTKSSITISGYTNRDNTNSYRYHRATQAKSLVPGSLSGVALIVGYDPIQPNGKGLIGPDDR